MRIFFLFTILIFSLFLLNSLDIDFIIILSNFAFEIEASNADPLSLVSSFEGYEFHFNEDILFLAELIIDLKERLFSKALNNRQSVTRIILFFFHNLFDRRQRLNSNEFDEHRFIFFTFLYFVIIAWIFEVLVIK